jgi:predicted Rossmann-fold nucleotide-binding protein
MSRRRHKEIEPPYRDPLFMESLPARPVRIITEYIDPLERLRREKVGDTIVMFGSARIEPRDRAQAHLHKLRTQKRRHATLEYRAALRDAKSALEMSRYYEEARELARRITSWAMAIIPGGS